MFATRLRRGFLAPGARSRPGRYLEVNVASVLRASARALMCSWTETDVHRSLRVT